MNEVSLLSSLDNSREGERELCVFVLLQAAEVARELRGGDGGAADQVPQLLPHPVLPGRAGRQVPAAEERTPPQTRSRRVSRSSQLS